MNIKKIGQCIKENRERKGLTTLQLAQLLKTDIVSVQSYEKGEKKPTVKELEVISNVLDIPLIVLLHGGGEVECFKEMRMGQNANGISIKLINPSLSMYRQN